MALTQAEFIEAMVNTFRAVGNQASPNKVMISKSTARSLHYEIKRVTGVRVLGSTVRFHRSRYEVR